MKKNLFLVLALVLYSFVCFSCDKEEDIVKNVSSSIEMHNGHEYVDLGLPSGLLWATCNVGADRPEDYGDYFAWGETESKFNYNRSTYKYYKGLSHTLTKYCIGNSYGSNGFTDNKTVLEMSDDAARVNWGGGWRMPTKEECDELSQECIWSIINIDGVSGYKVTSKTNGNSIFLPLSGYCDESGVNNRNASGDYWSIQLDLQYSTNAYYMSFNSDEVTGYNHSRYYGRSVRAVCLDTEEIPISCSINFNANGGIGEMSSVELWSDETRNLPVNTFIRKGYVFAGWNTTADASGTSYCDGQEISVKENLTLYAQWTFLYNSHEFVDLGLTSGLMWATCNIGAENPEDYGDYFAWGEVEPKSNYSWDTYSHCNGSSNNLIKYNVGSSWGIVDSITILGSEDDVARMNWGDNWRIPSIVEFAELKEECVWTFANINGVNGYTVTSITNGNSIFLPAAGYCKGVDFRRLGLNGYYWSSSLDSDKYDYAYCLLLDSKSIVNNSRERYYGHSVRPVLSINISIPTNYTISFDANGGKGIMSTIEIWSDETRNLPVNTFIREGYVFVGWNTVADGSGTSYNNNQNISVSQSLTLYAQWRALYESSGSHNGYEYVDLGLPSGLLWATCNVGAESPEDYGDYFAWGETIPKSDYSWKTYIYCTSGDIDSNLKFSKYNTDSDYGSIDNKTVLELSDDAARVNWGGSWRMPTTAEQAELVENCTWTWTTLNGVNGFKIISNTNGNSIFLPAAGYRNGTDASNAGSHGFFWSSSLDSSYPSYASCLCIYSSNVYWNSCSRYGGRTVRAVCQ